MRSGLFSGWFTKENKNGLQEGDPEEDAPGLVHMRALEPTLQNLELLRGRFIAVDIVFERKQVKEISAVNYIRCIPSGIFHENTNEKMNEKGLLEDFIHFIGYMKDAVLCFFDLNTAEILRDAFKWNRMDMDFRYINTGSTVKRLYPYRNDKRYTPKTAYSYFGTPHAREAEHLSAAECIGKSVCLIISDQHMSAALSKYTAFVRKKPEKTEVLCCAADLDTDYLDIGMEVTMEYNAARRRNVLVCNTRLLCIAENGMITAASEKTNRKAMFITDIRRKRKGVYITVNIYPDLPSLPFGFEDKQRYRVNPKDAKF